MSAFGILPRLKLESSYFNVFAEEGEAHGFVCFRCWCVMMIISVGWEIWSGLFEGSRIVLQYGMESNFREMSEAVFCFSFGDSIAD